MSRQQIEMNMIVAFCKGFGIGSNNYIPWDISNDLVNFKNLTLNNIVIMGRKTYFSIPERNRPLTNRLNIVVTNNPSQYENDTNVVFLSIDEVYDFVKIQYKYNKCFIIGGCEIYSYFIKYITNLYITYIDKEYNCDVKFPTLNMHEFKLDSYSFLNFSEKEQCNYRYLTYKRNIDITKTVDNKYLDLLQNIIDTGNNRQDRTCTGTRSVFGQQMRFDISKTIPLLTTKFIPWKMVIKELLWFLKGSTNSNKLKEQGVNIWNGNSTREFLDNRGLKDYIDGDIGPMYGWQWRHFGSDYTGCNTSYTNDGIDQLAIVMDLLINDPFSRRIIMTTYNVNDLEKGCLHPCHGLVVQFYVEEDINKQKYLSCHMYQRSVDVFLGLTWNIFSYAVLTYILAKKTNMLPKDLIISTGDTHLYNTHLEQANLQLERYPFPEPVLKLSDEIITKDFNDLSIEDFELIGYFHHPAIKATMSI